MPDIFHILPVNVPPAKVFDAISTPKGLERWWTKTSSGEAIIGNTYALFFSEAYDWRAIVTNCIPNELFELQMTEADAGWRGSTLGFRLTALETGTQLSFYHTGWSNDNEHYRTSSFCWAMYLRILKRWLEFGEEVVYEERLNV